MITTLESYTGIIERILFFSEKTGYTVFILKPDDKTQIAVQGITTARFGDRITCDGEWDNHPTYGQQFVASSIIHEMPKSITGIENYLSSGIIGGVGPATAKKIVSSLGVNTLEKLDNNIDLIKSVPGVSSKLAEKIKMGWKEHSAMRSIIVFLRGHEISQAIAYRIHRAYQSEAMEVLKTNPWKLAKDVNGIGFKKADGIAVGMGADLESQERISACLSYVIDEAAKNGHCGLLISQVLKESAELLKLSQEMIAEALFKVFPKPFVTENGMAWSHKLYHMESEIAEYILRLAAKKPNWSIPENDIAWIEKKNSIVLAENQREAMKMQLKSRTMIITGGPGCGKTFLLNSILSVFQKNHQTVLLAAPTGKAAVRMTEATGLPASTLHRLLKLGHGNAEPENLDCDLLVIDEFSMVDVMLFHKIIRALPKKAGILIVGDADQLPSVGAGAVLKDMIQSEKIPFVRLDHIFRQSQGSKIILNAHRINNGEMVHAQNTQDDFFFLDADSPENASSMICDLVSNRLPKTYGFDPVKDIQVLCPMNRSACGTSSMNYLLQEKLNPAPTASVYSFGMRIGVGDRVMQTVNNYNKGVFNGDSGLVEGINEESESLVRFPIGVVLYEQNELDELVLSYAMTIHKSQGSDFPVVIMPLLTSHYIMLQKKLVYTGITRAKKLCIIVGQKKALGIAIRNNKSGMRNTRLLNLLTTPQLPF